MKQILTKITNGEVLTREQTCQIVRHIADGEYNDVQISALLTGLIMQGASRWTKCSACATGL